MHALKPITLYHIITLIANKTTLLETIKHSRIVETPIQLDK